MSVGPGGQVRVALIGHAFMGAVHSHAWRNVAHAFALPAEPVMSVLCGRAAARVEIAGARLGWMQTSADWRAVVARDDIDLVDICVPGDLHAEIAIAALQAGKHVLCEKPLANDVEQASAMAAAAEAAGRNGTVSMVGFNYRRVPALALARSLVREGRLGEIRFARASYEQDWLVDPMAPITWRLRRDRAGTGALGDIGSHAVDLVQWLTGQDISNVVSTSRRYVDHRPLPADTIDGDPTTTQVDVDDAVVMLGSLDGGATVVLDASRAVPGRKNSLRLELSGSMGSLSFDLERMNELQHVETGAPAPSGFARILVTEPEHPYLEGWWPPGHVLGYEHTFVHQARDLITAVAGGGEVRPSFADGLRVQRVLAATARSADSGAWEPVSDLVGGVVERSRE